MGEMAHVRPTGTWSFCTSHGWESFRKIASAARSRDIGITLGLALQTQRPVETRTSLGSGGVVDNRGWQYALYKACLQLKSQKQQWRAK